MSNISLASIVARDTEFPPFPDHFPIPEHIQSFRDRRALIALLRQARAVIESINTCHGCLDQEDHEADKAFYELLVTLGD